jgi:ankyrin repeat protein
MSVQTNSEKKSERRALNAITAVAQYSAVSSPDGANTALSPLLHLKKETRRGNMAQALAGTAGPGGRTQLMAAAINGTEESLKFIRNAKDSLARSKGVNLQDVDGKTALAWAAEKNKTESVRALLSGRNKADVNIHDNLGSTPLSWASYHGNIDIVKILIEGGANVDLEGPNNKTPLYYASFEGHREVVKLLLEAGANTEIAENVLGWTPLMTATYEEHVDVVKLLLENRANINNVNGNIETALYIASNYGITNVMHILLEHKANTEIQELTNGWTALHVACRNNEIEAVRLLLNAGADVDAQDHQHRKPIILTEDPEIIKLLTKLEGGYSKTRRAPSRKRRGARRSRPTARNRRGA